MPTSGTRDPSTDAIAAAIAIAAGTAAYADPLRFDNDAGFQWDWDTWLDITKSGSHQTGFGGGEGTLQIQFYESYGYFVQGWSWVRPGAEVQVHAYGTYLHNVDAGTVIPDQIDPHWSRSPQVEIGHTYADGFLFNTLLPHTPTYLAVRFRSNGDTHYGWIGVQRDGDKPLGHEGHLTPFAWGYETEPNTSIAAGAVPAPGTLAALALGAAAAIGCGKRRNE